MSEYPNEEEQLTNPKPSGQSTGDDNWRGDAADQGNDIRFAEEQELIREQASPESVRRDDDGEYTDAEGSKEPPAGHPGKSKTAGSKETEGGYTDSEGTQD
ncbi:hypothetical protein H9638_00765 [Arthrobacter sp. Sa2BUA2]|uniref:Uncharacterized protein n=1 Tax=Arthrobacter pullicola TaxID=2762224 RepID=A0ABR8YDP8_9MICC|nr:hypothetical protein [Arthrobacter pullicola]MBD8042334.1 hypothetical protein [Arthrobacter pullicola]